MAGLPEYRRKCYLQCGSLKAIMMMIMMMADTKRVQKALSVD